MIVATAGHAADLLRPFFASAQGEVVAVAYLDREQRLIDARPVGEEGAAGEVALPVRRILEEALRLGAAALVVAHNHPSGDASPSAEDVEATRELADVAARLGVRVVDHLILGGDEVVSLRGLRLL